MLFETLRRKATMVSQEDALPGREVPLTVDPTHAVLGTSIKPPFPEGTEDIIVALGCFWGAERLFWQLPGVHTTAVGYAGGYTPNPTYEEVCTGRTGHTEWWRVVFDPAQVSLDTVLRTFWEGHDPTQGYRQGNDVRHAVPLGDLHHHALAGRRRAGLGRALRPGPRRPRTRGDHHGDR